MIGERRLQEGDSPGEASGMSHEELMQIPEIRQQIAEMEESHWDEWLDSRLPALDDMTPREAAKDPVGREKLEGLLLNFEASEQRHPGANAFAPDFDKLRHKLGLTGEVLDK